MEQPPHTPHFVGVDVSKDRLDVHVLPSRRAFAVPHTGAGLDQLVGELRAFSPALVVLEATGGFELTVAAALSGAGLPLAVVNPRQIRDFARATGRLAKTDALDAQVLAQFAEVMRPQPRPLPDAEARALAGCSETRQAARSLQADSDRWVVVKLGARGCLAVGPDEAELTAPAPVIVPADTTGAGDAFNAGLVHALSEGTDWPQALQAATRFASALIARPPGERHRWRPFDGTVVE